MNDKQARELICSLFQNSFDREKYSHFLLNLLNDITPGHRQNRRYSGNDVPHAFKQHINQYWCLGKYIDPNNEEVDLLVVEVRTYTQLERSRTTLRNFAVNRLKAFEKDCSLIAFYSKEDKGANWRFSFVKTEHGSYMDENTGKVKTSVLTSPAKRYSFLVGEHENSHTAQAQLVDMLAMDYANPTVKEIEKAFGIEKVTEEFFSQYKELFLELSTTLREQPLFCRIEDSKKQKKAVAKFAKKLLGQIVFLYFLQKKGWLGVKKDHDWGTGDRQFLRTLFNSSTNENYFDFKLKYLFYDALAQDRSNQHDPTFYDRFGCKIPFLNGGLFEAKYDWQNKDIVLDNSIFSNKENKAGDIGTGILDVFDRYNFTIKEDEPLEKEVAVDPEMLGKVFENMLDITERKSKGAFYTPREIVHYMCQESLIQYLAGEFEKGKEIHIPKMDIEFLIRKGHLVLDEDSHALKIIEKVDSGMQQGTEFKVQLPESIRENALSLDKKISEIKICDPAIGSGAFPVAILNEIVNIRTVLGFYIPQKSNDCVYSLKKHTIANSIYGVDIDPSAIDVARLRLWLSLIVDEDDYDKIDALPNLDYKIMQGNSLVDEYEGVKLFKKSFLEDNLYREREIQRLTVENVELDKTGIILFSENKLTKTGKKSIESKISINCKRIALLKQKVDTNKPGLFDSEKDSHTKAKRLEQLHMNFFKIDFSREKKLARKEIEKLEWELIEASLREQNETKKLEKIAELKKSGEKPFFLWELNFSEVFRNNGGFDIVLGNPPYLRIQGIRKEDPELADVYKNKYDSATGAFDLYVLFMERGCSFIHDGGILNYICPDKWVNASFGKGIRRLVSSKQNVRRLISFGAHQVFSASTYSSLLWMGSEQVDSLLYFKLDPSENSITCLESELNTIENSSFEPNLYENLSEEPWILCNRSNGKVLHRFLNQRRTLGDVFEKMFQGIATSKDSVYFLKKAVLCNGIYEADSIEFGKRIKIEEGLVKPLLLGGQVHKYQKLETTNLVIFPYELFEDDTKPALMNEEFIQSNFPYGYAYLKECEGVLRGRERGRLKNAEDWYRYIYPKNLNLFHIRKLMAPDISLGGNFTYDHAGDYYSTTTLYGYQKKEGITESYNYWLGILNSSMLWFYIKTTGAVLANGYYRYKPKYLENFPVPVVTKDREKKISCLVSYLLVLHSLEEKDDNFLSISYFEQLVDALVYELYFLQEIKAADKEILSNLHEMPQLTNDMSNEEKLAVIHQEFTLLYDPYHIVRNSIDTLDSIEEIRIIEDSLKK